MNRQKFLKLVAAASMAPLSGGLELLASGVKQTDRAKEAHITAFGPFGNFAVNPSQDASKYLSELGYQTTVLPVDYDKAPTILRRIIDSNPRIIIVLGKDTTHIVCGGIALLLRKFFLPF